MVSGRSESTKHPNIKWGFLDVEEPQKLLVALFTNAIALYCFDVLWAAPILRQVPVNI